MNYRVNQINWIYQIYWILSNIFPPDFFQHFRYYRMIQKDPIERNLNFSCLHIIFNEKWLRWFRIRSWFVGNTPPSCSNVCIWFVDLVVWFVGLVCWFVGKTPPSCSNGRICPPIPTLVRPQCAIPNGTFAKKRQMSRITLGKVSNWWKW